MPVTKGIPFLDLLGAPQGVVRILPAAVQQFLAQFNLLVHNTAVADGRVVYSGFIQTPLNKHDFSNFILDIPGLQEGIPFRLFKTRVAPTDTNQIEDNSGNWVIQLDVLSVKLKLPDLEAAQYVPPNATDPARLEAFPAPSGSGSSSTRPTVTISVEAGVLEITSDGDFRIRPDFTLDPATPSDFFLQVSVDPPNFFIAKPIGARIGQLIFDFSDSNSPQQARRAGFGDDFKGLYLEEATVFVPDIPMAGKKFRINFTLREALIGNAFAGEAQIDLGADMVNTPPVPKFFQVTETGQTELPIGANNQVEFNRVIFPTARIIAVADINPPWGDRQSHAIWEDPDGQRYTGARTPPFEVTPDGIVEYTYAQGQGFQVPTTQRYTFGGSVADGMRARFRIRYTHEGSERTLDDVSFISATHAWLSNAVLEITDLATDRVFSWLINYDVTLTRRSTESPTLNLGVLENRTGSSDQGEDSRRQRRQEQRVGIMVDGFSRYLLVDVKQDVSPIIVSAGNALEAGGGTVAAANFNKVFHLLMATRNGQLRQLTTPIPEQPTDGSLPGFQPGRLYQGTANGTYTRTNDPTPRTLTVFSIFFRTNQSGESGIAGYQTFTNVPNLTSPVTTSFTNASASQVRTELQEWIGHLQSGNVFAVGRTSRTGDLRAPSTAADLGPNQRLERERADTVGNMANQLISDAGTGGVDYIGDRGEFSEGIPVGWQEGLGDSTRLATAPGNAASENHGLFQRADIYFRSTAADGTNAQFAGIPGDSEEVSTNQRILLPGPPNAPSPSIPPIDTESRLRRLRLLAKWDREPFPTKMEAEMVLQLGGVPVPVDEELNTDPANTTESCPDAADDFLRLLLRFVQDEQTGLARWSATIDSAEDEDGLFRWCDTKALGAMLLLGPLVASDPPIDELDKASVRWVAAGTMLGASIVLTSLDDPIIKDVNLTINAISVEFDINNMLQEGDTSLEAFRILLDYSVSFGVDLDGDGLGRLATEDNSKVRIRYRNVGLEYTGGGAVDSFDDLSWDNFNFLFDPSKGGNVEVEDPGKFLIDGAIGDILNVSAVRLGHGSLFLELDLMLGLDLGVVEISETTIRVAFTDSGPEISIGGIEAKVEIPGTLIGAGKLQIDNTDIKAELDLEIIPAGLKASGSFQLSKQADYTAVAVGVDVELSTGLPLGGTGLGIFGFFGRFAANMTRNVNLNAPDRVAEELRWLRAILGNSSDSWRPEKQQWGLGFGVVIGTLPDGGKSFHAKGGFVLEIPGPTVIFGIDAAFLQQRRETKSDGNDLSGTITGLVLVDPYTVLIGIEVKIEVGSLIELAVPIGLLFPRKALPGETEKRPYYIRIGSDGAGSRTGSPVRAVIKAGGLGEVAKVFAFLMFEERELLNLYNRDELDFYGFSIGFGFGIEVGWGNDFISLNASALLLVGLGTSPFALVGIFSLSGEIKLLVFTISASAELDFRHDARGTVFTGKFCAKISFFFFSVEGCVSLTIGDGDPYKVLPPPLLVTGFGLLNRKAEKIAHLQIDQDGEAGQPSDILGPVWPDAVPVIHFAHAPATNLNSSSSFQALVEIDRNEEVRVGDYVYTFSLDSVSLEKQVGTNWQAVPGPLDAAWWFPTHREAFLSDPSHPPSGEETRDLGLLSWHPAPWAKQLIPEVNEDTFDQVGGSIEILCEPISPPPSDCAFFLKTTIGDTAERWMVASENQRFKAIVYQAGYSAETYEQLLPQRNQRDIQALALSRSDLWLQTTEHFNWGTPTPWNDQTLEGGLWIPYLQSIGIFNAGSTQERIFMNPNIAQTLSLTAVVKVAQPLVDGVLLLAVRQPSLEIGYNTIPEELSPSEFMLLPQVAVFDEAQQFVGNTVATLVSNIRTEAGQFLLYEYRPEREQAFSYWRIGAFWGSALLVSTCGRDAAAWFRAQNMERVRQRWIAAAEDHADTTSDPSTTPPTPSQFLLEANARYRVSVTWSWQGYHKKKPGDITPSASVTQRFGFRTAPYITNFGELRTSLEQDRFDARALQYYITKSPDLKAPPTFLNDTLQVHFSTDHIEALLAKYDRQLKLEVLRVDVPRQPLAEGGGPLSVLFSATYQRIPYYFIDELLTERLRGLPCGNIEQPQLGGVGTTLDINLAPLGRYELVLSAPPTGNAAEDLDRNLILRAPFVASRYADAEELIAALGFGAIGDASNFPAVEEWLLEASLSIAAALPGGLTADLYDDIALAKALAALAFDDLEIPEEGRTIVFWQQAAAGGWQIAGVLLDGAEALQRPGRLAFTELRARNQRLPLLRCSKAGNRLLFYNLTPSPVKEEKAVRMEVHFRENDSATVERMRLNILPHPQAILYEI